MIDIILVVILLVILGAAALFIWKEKKRGKKCIGCPYAGTSGCSCGKK